MLRPTQGKDVTLIVISVDLISWICGSSQVCVSYQIKYSTLADVIKILSRSVFLCKSLTVFCPVACQNLL